jgi:hypothetical protein
MKQIVPNYSFDKTAKTVTFSDFSSIRLDRILLITNVTSNVVIYQFNNNSLGGTVAGNVLTLTYDTSAMNNSDKLQIIYDTVTGDPTYSQSVVKLADNMGKTPQRAVVSLNASGNVISAVPGRLIKVYAFAAQSRNDNMTLQITDGVGGSSLSLRWALNTREGVSQPAVAPPAYYYKNAAVNTAIYAAITGVGTIDIEISYYADDAS